MKKIVFYHKNIKRSPLKDAILINNANSDLDHRMWSELAGYKLLYDMINTKDDINEWPPFEFISLNHYRRIFDENITNKTIIPIPMIIPCTLYNQYAIYHNINDLKIMESIVKTKYPYLSENFDKVMNGNVLIPYTIGIMPVNQFKDYWYFLYDVLSEVLKVMNISTFDEMLNRVKNDNNYIGEYKNEKPEYQARVLSFLAERLSTLYWFYLSDLIPIYFGKVKLLEENQMI